MKILALDLGTETGFAHNLGVSWTAGTWKLATDAEIKKMGENRMRRRCDIRVLRLENALRAMDGIFSPDIVVFEDVLFASSTYQVQLWASLRTIIWLAFRDRIVDCVPVQTLKKFATGHGGATKQMMSAALKRKHPEKWSPELGHDAVDAAWIFLWAEHTFARLK